MCEFIPPNKSSRQASSPASRSDPPAARFGLAKYRLRSRPPRARRDPQPPAPLGRRGSMLPQQTALAPGTRGRLRRGVLQPPGRTGTPSRGHIHHHALAIPSLPGFCKSILMFAARTRLREVLLGVQKAACLFVNKLYTERKLPTPGILARRLQQ